MALKSKPNNSIVARAENISTSKMYKSSVPQLPLGKITQSILGIVIIPQNPFILHVS